MIVAPEQVPDIIAADPDDNAILSGTYQGIPILDGLHFLYVVRGDRLPDTTA